MVRTDSRRLTRRAAPRGTKRRWERGVALVYVTATLFTLLIFTGLAVDMGRAYLVRSNLGTAVDAAALVAANRFANGTTVARAEAVKIYNANFPAGYLGVTPNAPQIDFALGSDGSNIATVSATATLGTTFSRIAGFNTLNVAARGQATRRLVDMALVIDHSGSIGSAWPAVQAAAKQFVGYFDANSDRVSLIFFSITASIADPINASGRGFSASSIISHIDATSATGATATAEGLYQGWDQLRAVSTGAQSPLRVIVLFTDGAPNTWSGRFVVDNGRGGTTTVDGALTTSDFPNTPSGGTSTPSVTGVYEAYSLLTGPTYVFVSPTDWSYTTGSNSNIQTLNVKIPEIPRQSYHATHRSSGIPTAFNLYTSGLSGQRTLIGGTATGYPDHVQNANNAARNLVEVIANAARSDSSGAFPIKIYTLGLGVQLNENMGAALETGSSILKRVANDPTSPSFNPSQPEGKYYFAGNPSELNAAFEAVRNQIVRFSE